MFFKVSALEFCIATQRLIVVTLQCSLKAEHSGVYDLGVLNLIGLTP
jgi:hypothetical protein